MVNRIRGTIPSPEFLAKVVPGIPAWAVTALSIVANAG